MWVSETHCSSEKLMNAQERATEVMRIFTKLRDMQLGILEYEEMVQFRGICNTFIKDGISVRGKIPIPGTQRIILYNFSEDRVECMLKYQEHV